MQKFLALFLITTSVVITIMIEDCQCSVFETIANQITTSLIDKQKDQKLLVDLGINPENVLFYIYPPPSGSPPIQIDTTTSAKSLIDSSKPTKILIHGWEASAKIDWLVEIASNYHQIGDFNVLAVDWSIDANNTYDYSAIALQSVGYTVGRFILNLTENLKSVHLVGHSFGAHVSGFAGKLIRDSTGKQIGRISGLDPAGPLFVLRPNHLRLCEDDAEFVDVIHTNVKVVGIYEECGTVDFYPYGGGPVQPQCKGSSDENGCSHNLVTKMFAESILNPDYCSGARCDSIVKCYLESSCEKNQKIRMGEHIDKSVSGKVYSECIIE